MKTTIEACREAVDKAEQIKNRAERRHKNHGSQDTFDILVAAQADLKHAERDLANLIRGSQKESTP